MRSFLICDDHALMREAMAGIILSEWPDAKIDEVTNFTDAYLAVENEYDLCVCDLLMPGAEPLEGIICIKATAPDMPILVFTGTQDDHLMLQLIRAGVNGFVEKSKNGKVINAAIHLIFAGEKYVPPRILDIDANPISTAPVAFHMTDQQRRVIALVAQGKSNKSIAIEMGVAPSTIKSHLEQAMRSTASTSRFEVVNKARAAGLIF